jgi:hypothetical protein
VSLSQPSTSYCAQRRLSANDRVMIMRGPARQGARDPFSLFSIRNNPARFEPLESANSERRAVHPSALNTSRRGRGPPLRLVQLRCCAVGTHWLCGALSTATPGLVLVGDSQLWPGGKADSRPSPIAHRPSLRAPSSYRSRQRRALPATGHRPARGPGGIAGAPMPAMGRRAPNHGGRRGRLIRGTVRDEGCAGTATQAFVDPVATLNPAPAGLTERADTWYGTRLDRHRPGV